MAAQAESIQQARENLSSLGLDLARASFEIGWELAHLAGSPPQGSGNNTGILEVKDLTASDEMRIRVDHIKAAWEHFSSYLKGQSSNGETQDPPDPGSLEEAIGGSPEAIQNSLLKFNTAMVGVCALLDGTTTAAQPNASASIINGLHDAYEVGRLLAVVVLKARDAETCAEFTQYLSVDPRTMPETGETPAFRAYSLLGGLRGVFPSAAAYSVARHIEDWSAWVNGDGKSVDNSPGDFNTDKQLKAAERSIVSQGRVWRSLLAGQTLGVDYLVATSYTDAANHLFVSWSANASTIAQAFRRTSLWRFVRWLVIIIGVIFLGAFLVDLLTKGGATSGAKNGLTIATVLAAAASAFGIFHVSRSQITSVLDDVWGLVEPSALEAELIESIALSTRRMPLDTVGGTSPPQTKTMDDRLRRAMHGSLPQVSADEKPALTGSGTSPAQ
jgi:hypothetical protein